MNIILISFLRDNRVVCKLIIFSSESSDRHKKERREKGDRGDEGIRYKNDMKYVQRHDRDLQSFVGKDIY